MRKYNQFMKNSCYNKCVDGKLAQIIVLIAVAAVKKREETLLISHASKSS